MFTDANLDQNLILEILERTSSVSDIGAGEYYFQDLVSAVDATFASISSVKQFNVQQKLSKMPQDAVGSIVTGEMVTSKGRQGPDALNKIHVMLMVLRLPHVSTDMLLTLNTPIFIHAASASAAQAGSGYKDTHMQAPRLFHRIMASLEIDDWGLFGG